MRKIKLVIVSVNVKKKVENEMIEILFELKSRNLPKYKSENLCKSKKIQNVDAIKEFNFLNSSTKVVFTKLRQVFT